MNALTSNQLRSPTSAQITALTTDQVGALTTEPTWNALTTDECRSSRLPRSRCDDRADQQPDGRQSHALGTAQFAALTSDQAGAFTTAQMNKLEQLVGRALSSTMAG